MGDECTCEKCQAGSAGEPESDARPFVNSEAQADGYRRSRGSLYLVVTDRGISLRPQSREM